MNFEDKTYQQLLGICDKVVLSDKISLITLFIAMYENFADVNVDRVESFICDMTFEDGEIKYKHNDEYKRVIINRKIDDDGNRNILKATLLWFVDQSAITKDDYDKFSQIKKLRNHCTHKMAEVIINSEMDDIAKGLADLFVLYYKIDNWWINEIEIPIRGEFKPGDYDEKAVTSVTFQLFNIMKEVLFEDKSKEFVEIINSIQNMEE